MIKSVTVVNHLGESLKLDLASPEKSGFIVKSIEGLGPVKATVNTTKMSTTDGALYFDERIQKFLKKFSGNISMGITLDGPKEIHDACRVYHDGRGNFDDAYAAMKHFNSNYYKELGTKVTIAPGNLKNLNKIIDFFVSEGMKIIHANCVYEEEWTIDQAKTFYSELKVMADKLLDLNDDTTISLFDELIAKPKKS